MNNKLFGSTPMVQNEAGGKAYARSDKQALAQFAATGCFGNTYYVSDEQQLAKVIELCKKVEPEFVAKVAVYARERGLMKDMPAVLLALISKNTEVCEKAFNRVINDGKMLRNLVQVIRSGTTGRKSLGSYLKRKINQTLNSWSADRIFKNSIGDKPSLGDVINLSHPKGITPEHEAIFGWLIGSEKVDATKLPIALTNYMTWKQNPTTELPDVPFLMLTSVENLTPEIWAAIARKATWNQTRMNLNSFVRHNVFTIPGMDKIIADKLRDRDEVLKAKVFPYQLMSAYMNAGGNVPPIVALALQEAMEHAIENVPTIAGQVVVAPDISESMDSPATGQRGSATTKVTCRDVAALISAALIRKNPTTRLLPFSNTVQELKVNPLDSVMTNAEHIRRLPSGGTDCSLPLFYLNQHGIKADLVVYVSDNESWLDNRYYRRTGMADEWAVFKRNNPNARLVCIDITPSATSQVQDGGDRLNVGGFSDTVFDLIATFARGEMNADHWVGAIENMA
jgi:60 kDa SS-A/Ro ribonucleoprotein